MEIISEEVSVLSLQEGAPIAIDNATQAMLKVAARAALSPATILITGETGVGKELLARYVHNNSPRNNHPYVSVNCAAMPESMVEAILFGYEKGAFTGALQTYQGKFEQANHGTILLDEVSELPIHMQSKLLRVIQEREVDRLGGKESIKIDVRIIAATNKDIKEQVRLGAFREDLYYRLNVIPITCPPLRQRKSDIIPLAQYLLSKHSAAVGRQPPVMLEDALIELKSYYWPGNIRELDNLMQRISVLSLRKTISAKELEMFWGTKEGALHDSEDQVRGLNSTLKQNEASLILSTLKNTNGSRIKTAEILKVSQRTLRYKLSKLKSMGIEVP